MKRETPIGNLCSYAVCDLRLLDFGFRPALTRGNGTEDVVSIRMEGIPVCHLTDSGLPFDHPSIETGGFSSSHETKLPDLCAVYPFPISMAGVCRR